MLMYVQNFMASHLIEQGQCCEGESKEMTTLIMIHNFGTILDLVPIHEVDEVHVEVFHWISKTLICTWG